MDTTNRTTQAKKVIKEFLENDPKVQATELGKNIAGEATAFIKANPWAAVLGAAVIGYLLGSMQRDRNGERK